MNIIPQIIQQAADRRRGVFTNLGQSMADMGLGFQNIASGIEDIRDANALRRLNNEVPMSDGMNNMLGMLRANDSGDDLVFNEGASILGGYNGRTPEEIQADKDKIAFRRQQAGKGLMGMEDPNIRIARETAQANRLDDINRAEQAEIVRREQQLEDEQRKAVQGMNERQSVMADLLMKAENNEISKEDVFRGAMAVSDNSIEKLIELSPSMMNDENIKSLIKDVGTINPSDPLGKEAKNAISGVLSGTVDPRNAIPAVLAYIISSRLGLKEDDINKPQNKIKIGNYLKNYLNDTLVFDTMNQNMNRSVMDSYRGIYGKN